MERAKTDQNRAKSRIPDHTFRAWLVIDQAGAAHARIERAGLETARQIAKSAFPELDGNFRLVPPCEATKQQRRSAAAVILTPERCRKYGLVGLSGEWASRLQKHFRRVGGAR